MKLLSLISCCIWIQIHSQNLLDVLNPGRIYFEGDIPIFVTYHIITGLEADNSKKIIISRFGVNNDEISKRNSDKKQYSPPTTDKNLNKNNDYLDKIVFRDDDYYNCKKNIELKPSTNVQSSIQTQNHDEYLSKKGVKVNDDFIPLISQNFNNLKHNSANAYPNTLDTILFNKNMKTDINEKRCSQFYSDCNKVNNPTIKFANTESNILKPLLPMNSTEMSTTVGSNILTSLSDDLTNKVSAITPSVDLDLSVFDDNKGQLDLSVFDDNKDQLDLSVFDDNKDQLDLSVFDDNKGQIDLSVFDDNKSQIDLTVFNNNKDQLDLSVFDVPATDDLDLSVFDEAIKNPTNVQDVNLNAPTGSNGSVLDLSVFDNIDKNNTSTTTSGQIDLSVFDENKSQIDLSVFNNNKEQLDLSVFDVPATDDLDLSVFDEAIKNPTNVQDVNLNAPTGSNGSVLDLSVLDNIDKNNTSTTTSYLSDIDLSVYDQFKQPATGNKGPS